MEIEKVYFVDSDSPSSFVPSGRENYLKIINQEYDSSFSHIPFIYHEYSSYWDKGVPIIHITNHANLHTITVFLPQLVSSKNADYLFKTLDEIQNDYKEVECKQKLIYIKDKHTFGYDYECYPPAYRKGPDFPFQDAVKLFLRDSSHRLTDEESSMFKEFRLFDMKSMLSSDDRLYYYPVNHNYCGVLVVDREGKRYASTVTKTKHQEELGYLLLKMTGHDVLKEKMGTVREIINSSLAVLFFREGDVMAYIPEKINESQYQELSNVIDEVDIISNNSSQVFSGRVLSTGNLVDDELSFRENISKSYSEFQRTQSRGRRP